MILETAESRSCLLFSGCLQWSGSCSEGALTWCFPMRWCRAPSSVGQIWLGLWGPHWATHPPICLDTMQGVRDGATGLCPALPVWLWLLSLQSLLGRGLAGLKGEKQRRNALPSLVPSFSLQEIVCKLCKNPENQFIKGINFLSSV